MFTPAAAGANRLRPWCVLVVVEQATGCQLVRRADAPLPCSRSTDPAVPGQELPDLRESWAWAHGQILEEARPLEAPDLDDDPIAI